MTGAALRERLRAVAGSPWAGRLGLPAVLAGYLLATNGVAHSTLYTQDIVLVAAVFGILAVSLDLVAGMTGLYSLGHAGLFAIGAYTTTLLNERRGWDVFVLLPVSMGVCALAGIVLGALSLRVSGLYFAITTFVFTLVVGVVASDSKFTGGLQGISGPLFPDFPAGMAGLGTSVVWCVALCLLFAVAVVWCIRRSPMYPVLLAIRDAEPFAAANGVRTSVVKVGAFGLSAALAGMAGWAFSFLGFISPGQFTWTVSVNVLVMVILGGMNTTLGPLLGAAFVSAFPVYVHIEPLTQEVIFGCVFVAVIVFAPRGAVGLLAAALRRVVPPAVGANAGGPAGGPPSRTPAHAEPADVPAAPAAAGPSGPSGLWGASDAAPGAPGADGVAPAGGRGVGDSAADGVGAGSGKPYPAGAGGSSGAGSGGPYPAGGGSYAAQTAPGASGADGVAPAVECRGIRFSYVKGVRALDGVDFAVRAGTVHGLIGPNGSGKSTLVDVICGRIRPDGGTVAIGGQRVDRLGAAARPRHGLARTFQTAVLVKELRARDNVGIGFYGTVPRIGLRSVAWPLLPAGRRDGRTIRSRSATALERVGMAGWSAARVGDVPHGVEQLVQLAAACADQPSVLVLDEPLAGLSRSEVAEVSAILTELRHQDTTVIVIEHRTKFIFDICDEVTVLAAGELVTSGPAAEVRADARVREVYLGQ